MNSESEAIKELKRMAKALRKAKKGEVKGILEDMAVIAGMFGLYLEQFTRINS